MSLLAELKRRNVIHMARLHLGGTWLFVQVTGTLLRLSQTASPTAVGNVPGMRRP